MSTDILGGIAGACVLGGLLIVFAYVGVMLFSRFAPRAWNELIDRFL